MSADDRPQPEPEADSDSDSDSDPESESESEFESESESASADDADSSAEALVDDLYGVVELSAEQLRLFSGRVLAALDLSAGDAAHRHLAEQALWLLCMNQDEALRVTLEDLLDGLSWSALFPAQDEEDQPRVTTPALNRLALGLSLQQRAAHKGPGAAQRALAAICSLALACADPHAGRRLRRGFGRLDLLAIADQIPVAARIRLLALEYRHLPPTTEPPPAGFVARVEDLLEQLDAQGLLPYGLDDLPGRKPSDPAMALLEVLLPGSARSLRTVARVLLGASVPFASLAELHEACVDEAPDRWGLRAQSEELPDLERDYGELRGAFTGTPFALRADGRFGRA